MCLGVISLNSHFFFLFGGGSYFLGFLNLDVSFFPRLGKFSAIISLNSTCSPFDILLGPLCMPSHFSHVWLFVILWTIDPQVPFSMGFSGQEYWSRLLFPSPGDLPDPRIEPAVGRFFTTSVTWDIYNAYSLLVSRKSLMLFSLFNSFFWLIWVDEFHFTVF